MAHWFEAESIDRVAGTWSGPTGFFINSAAETSIGLHQNVPGWYCHNASFQCLSILLPIGLVEVPLFLLRYFDDWELESNVDQGQPVVAVWEVIQDLAI